MSDVFRKLNLKEHEEILVLNAPASFEPELAALEGVRVVRDVKTAKRIVFSLAFVIKQDELDSAARAIAAKAEGDAVVWFAYPKASSKNYKCEFSRDSGWAVLGEEGFEGVRMVAIDQDWSALRFRRVEYIKSMKRDRQRAGTRQGKLRTSKRA